MQENSYYGSHDVHSISYLEFGSLNLKEKSKKIWAYWQDAEAYDLYMFSRYARDLLSFKKLIANITPPRGGGSRALRYRK